MQYYKLVIIYIGLFVNSTKLFAQRSDSVSVQLSMVKDTITRRVDLAIKVVIEPLSSIPLIVPNNANWGFLHEKGRLGYFSIELQKLIGTKYINVGLSASIDNAPTLKATDTLSRNDTKTEVFFLGGCFKPNEGDYRVRVLCAIRQYAPAFADTYSNWVYFHCIKNVQMFPDE